MVRDLAILSGGTRARLRVSYHPLSLEEVSVLKVLARVHSDTRLRVVGLHPATVVATLRSLAVKGLVNEVAATDGPTGDLTADGREWLRAYGITV